MNNFLLWLGGLLVVAFAALFAVPYFVDWNSYRGVFEEEATRVLGRKVRVGGAVNLQLLPMPYVHFEKVRIADDTGKLGAPFFSAEGFTLWLSVPPLLRGILEVKKVELVQPSLNLSLDKDGGGNWRSFSFVPGSLSFVPNAVALQSLKIIDGRASLRLRGDREAVVFSRIDGELSADALHGPYRFRGNLDLEGERYDVRLSSGRPEQDGSVRVKAVTHSSRHGASYVLDGIGRDLSGAANFEGDLTADIPIAGVVFQEKDGGSEGGRSRPEPHTRFEGPVSADDVGLSPLQTSKNSFNLKSKVALNSVGFDLSDILITFDGDGRPQLMTGHVGGEWRTAPALSVDLMAQWLDVDQFGGSGRQSAPLETSIQLLKRVFGLVMHDWNAKALIKVDQVNLGGEIVSDVIINLRRDAGRAPLLQELSFAMPGGVRLIASGELPGDEAAGLFNGRVDIRGTSLTRFLRWLSQGQYTPNRKADRAFSIVGATVVKNGLITTSDLKANLGEKQVSGRVTFGFAGEKSLGLVLEGDDIELEPFAPGLLTGLIDGHLQAGELGVEPSRQSPPGGQNQVVDAGTLLRSIGGSLRIELRAGRIDDGVVVLRNVDARLERIGGSLKVDWIKWTAPSGLRVEGSGDVVGSGKSAKGNIKGWLTAETREAVDGLATFLGKEGVLTGLLAPTLTGTKSINIAFSSLIGGTTEPDCSVTLDGLVDGTPVRATFVLAGGLEGWRERAIEATASIQPNDLFGVVRRIGLEAERNARHKTSEEGDRSFGNRQLDISIVGPNASRLRVNVGLRSKELHGDFSGDAAISKDNKLQLSGRIDLAVADLGDVLEAADLGWKPVIQNTSISGFALLRITDREVSIAPQALNVNGSSISGRLSIVEGKSETPGRIAVRGTLDVSDLSVDRALGLISSKNPSEAESTGWTNHSFNLSSLNLADVDISLSAKQVAVLGSEVLTDARGRVVASRDGLVVDDIEGANSGGSFRGRLSLLPQQIGAQFTTSGQLDGVKFNQWTSLTKEQGIASGIGSISFDMAGIGTGLRSVFSNLKGTGVVVTKDLVVAGLASDLVHRSAKEVLIKGRDSPDSTGQLLTSELRAMLATGRFLVGSHTLPFKISDGVLGVTPLRVVGAGSEVGNTTTIDLGILKIDSEWQFRATQPVRLQVGDKIISGNLPPVSLVFVGPLDRLHRIEPRVVADALERELTVLRMEQSVEKLEQLRREDDRQARQEAQRLRVLEEERRRGLEAAKAQSGGSVPADQRGGRIFERGPQRMQLGRPTTQEQRIGLP